MAYNNKQTLYEILGVDPDAATADIKAAHHAMTRVLVSGKTGLPHEEIMSRLQQLDLALNTLTSRPARDAYDAGLAASHTSLDRPASTHLTTTSQSVDYNPIALANALVEPHQHDELMVRDAQHPLKILSATASSSISILKTIFRTIGAIFVLIIVIKASAGLLMSSHQPDMYAQEKTRAEDMVIIQDYYEKHGVRPADRAEAERLELEDKRKKEEQQQTEREQKRQEEAYNRFVETSRMEGERVTRDLELAAAREKQEEERARREAEWARQREEAQEAEERAREEQEMARQQQEKQQQERAQEPENSQNNPDSTQN